MRVRNTALYYVRSILWSGNNASLATVVRSAAKGPGLNKCAMLDPKDDLQVNKYHVQFLGWGPTRLPRWNKNFTTKP